MPLVPGERMLFLITKVLGLLVDAGNLIVIVALAGALALTFGRPRLGKVLVWSAALGLLLVGFGPVSWILMRPLEDRFPRPPADMAEPTGIVVLGGVIRSYVTQNRDMITFSQDGGRLTEGAALAHRYPHATLVFTGGSFADIPEPMTEGAIARRFFVSQGLEESRIVLEGKALTTAENARYTRELIMPQPGQRWLLVTSASHMPRAVGAFRRAGFSIIPYPVAYTTSGRVSDYWTIAFDASANLVRTDVALHEWVGLLYNWLAGTTDSLFPGPDAPHQD